MTDKTVGTVDSQHDLAVDQRLALETAGTRLEEEFADSVGPHTAETLLHSSYDELASHASVPNYLPLLAERSTRERLTQTRG